MPVSLAIFFILLAFSPVSHAADAPLVLNHQKVKELALSQGLEAEISRNQEAAAILGISQAKSLYDTLLKSRVNYEKDENQKPSPVFGTRNETTIFNTEVQQATPLGTSVGVGFLNTRQKTNSAFTTFPDFFDTQIYASIRQPIAKNFLGYLNRKQIQEAIKQAEALQLEAQARIQGYVFQTLVAYWQLYLGERNVELEKNAYTKAQKLQSANSNKMDRGLIEQADLSAFTSNSDIRKSFWIGSKVDLLRAREIILRELNLTSLDQTPKTSRESFVSSKMPPFNEMLNTAFSKRPDYLAQKKKLELANIKLKMAKNQRWPQLDVLASLNLNGVDSDYSPALDEIGENHPKWQVGMEFNFPLQNRASRASAKIGELEKKNEILKLKKIENEITSQIRTAHENYKLQTQRLAALQTAITSQKKRIDEELSRFEQGRSDSDSFIRAENDLIDAQKYLLKAQVDFKLAETDLKYAQGRILD